MGRSPKKEGYEPKYNKDNKSPRESSPKKYDKDRKSSKDSSPFSDDPRGFGAGPPVIQQSGFDETDKRWRYMCGKISVRVANYIGLGFSTAETVFGLGIFIYLAVKMKTDIALPLIFLGCQLLLLGASWPLMIFTARTESPRLSLPFMIVGFLWPFLYILFGVGFLTASATGSVDSGAIAYSWCNDGDVDVTALDTCMDSATGDANLLLYATGFLLLLVALLNSVKFNLAVDLNSYCMRKCRHTARYGYGVSEANKPYPVQGQEGEFLGPEDLGPLPPPPSESNEKPKDDSNNSDRHSPRMSPSPRKSPRGSPHSKRSPRKSPPRESPPSSRRDKKKSADHDEHSSSRRAESPKKSKPGIGFKEADDKKSDDDSRRSSSKKRRSSSKSPPPSSDDRRASRSSSKHGSRGADERARRRSSPEKSASPTQRSRRSDYDGGDDKRRASDKKRRDDDDMMAAFPGFN